MWFVEQKGDFSVYMTLQMDKCLWDSTVWTETEKVMCPSWIEMPGIKKTEHFADAKMT